MSTPAEMTPGGVWLRSDMAAAFLAAMRVALRQQLAQHPGTRVPDDLLATLQVLSTAVGTKVDQPPVDPARSEACIRLGVGDPSPLSVSEVATLLGCSPRAVTKAIGAGRLKATRDGREWRIDPADVELLRRKKVAA